MICLLPLEIIDHISHYLLKEDYDQLVLVNRAFYSVFILYLYKISTFYTENRLRAFLDAPEYHALVQHLNAAGLKLSKRDLQRITTSFPFLRSIDLDIGDHVDLPAFYQSFRFLSSLSLNTPKAERCLLDILSATPRLKSLSVGSQQRVMISLDTIELVHQLCPLLESLSITGRDSAQPMTAAFEPSPSIYTLKTLTLKLSTGLDQYHPWLAFVGSRYHHLVSLNLWHLGTSRDMLRQFSAEFYDRFLSCCPQLVCFEWCNILPSYTFFQQLGHHKRQLKHLMVFDNYFHVSPFIKTSLFDPNYMSTIQHLTISLPVFSEINPLVELLGKACPLLNHLGLSHHTLGHSNALHIDTVLDSCPRLISLELTGFWLRVKEARLRYQQQQQKTPLQHALNSMVINRCSLFTGFFDYIAITCHHFKYLTMSRTTQRDRRYTAHVHLPLQKLHKVQLENIQTEKYESDRAIQLFHVHQTDQNHQWFFMKSSDLAHPLFQKLDKVDTDILNNALSVTPSLKSGIEHSVDHSTSVFRDQDVVDIIKTGHVDFVCQSVRKLYINQERLI